MQLIFGFHVDLGKSVNEDPGFRVFSKLQILTRLILTQKR